MQGTRRTTRLWHRAGRAPMACVLGAWLTGPGLAWGGGVAIALGASPAMAQNGVEPVSPGDLRDLDPEERRRILLEERRAAEALQRDRRAELMRQRTAAEAGDDPQEAVAGASPEGGDVITFDAFAEGLELRTLVDYVAQRLGINVLIRGELSGSVVFNARQEVPEERLFVFLESLLDQFGFGVTLDPDTGFYTIAPIDALAQDIGGELGTTRIIQTPSVRPSALQPALTALFGGGNAVAGRAPGAGGGSGAVTLSFVDDLGVIIASGPPRRLRQVQGIVDQLLEQYGKLGFYTMELTHVAAPAARQRIVELVSRSAGGARRLRPTGAAEGQINIPGLSQSLDNLAERLTADPSSNALIFRGTEDEAVVVRGLIMEIDRPSMLVPRKYFAGGAARQIADIASQRGLGEVISLDTGQGDAGAARLTAAQRQQVQRGLAAATGGDELVSGGSAMVVDEQNGTIIYYGTEAQQEQLAALIDQLDTEAEVVVIREYKLQHADAENVAELLNALINNEIQQADAPLLGSARDRRNRATGIDRVFDRDPNLADRVAEATESGGIALTASDDLFVIADTANNQVLVKAPLRAQRDFAQLIAKIDLRRAQVYIEATIVTVSNTRSSRLAIEGAIINAGGDPVIQTLFGLTSADNDGITFPRTVNPNLSGLTTAVINSDFVPLVLTAIQTDTDARIESTPQLLVNDNEEASIESIQSEPTTTTQVGETSDITSFGGFEDATTSLTVTPSISEAGELLLDYEVTLEDFVGVGSDGIPPPRTSQILNGSVTLPDNTTVVVGGITVKDRNENVNKVPILGDLPLIGVLFRDTRQTETESLLYVFITPRIMRDPGFADLRLLTKGPQAAAEIEGDFPEIKPARIPILDIDQVTGRTMSAPRIEETLPATTWQPLTPTPMPTPAPAPAPLATPPAASAPTEADWPESAPTRSPSSPPANQPNIPPPYVPAPSEPAGRGVNTSGSWPEAPAQELSPTRPTRR